MRIKDGVTTKKRHKKILKVAKGYRDKRSNVYSLARRAIKNEIIANALDLIEKCWASLQLESRRFLRK